MQHHATVTSDTDSDLTDWLLTKDERGNPATRLDDGHPGDQAWSEGNLVRPLIHGATLLRRAARAASRRPARATWSSSPTGRATPTSGSPASPAARWPRCSAAPTSAASTSGGWCGARTRSFRLHRRGEPQARRGAPATRRRGAARHAGAARWLAPPEVRGDPAPRRPDPRHRLRRRHRPVPLPPRRRRPPRRPAGADELATEYGARPPWHDIQAAISGPAVHDVETVFRERWEDPTPLSRNPVTAGGTGSVASTDDRIRCPRKRLPRRRSTAARTSSSCCGPTRTCGTAATTRSHAVASAASPAATPRRCCGPGAWCTSRTSTSGATTSATSSPRPA